MTKGARVPAAGSPDTLSLDYIATSTILSFFSDLGVRLDFFYKFLWRHVLIVELIKTHFKIDTESDKKTFTEHIKHLFRSEKDKKALQYLEECGGRFWEETEHRIKEHTTKLTTELEGTLSAKIAPLAGMVWSTRS